MIDDDFLGSPPSRLIPRIGSRLRVARARMLARLRWRAADRHPADIRDELGVWNFPDEHRVFLERLAETLAKYEPREYFGPITLVRARSQTLWTYLGYDLGWSSIARGGLDIKVVAGAHDNILTEPRVFRTAEHLSASFDAAAGRMPSLASLQGWR